VVSIPITALHSLGLLLEQTLSPEILFVHIHIHTSNWQHQHINRHTVNHSTTINEYERILLMKTRKMSSTTFDSMGICINKIKDFSGTLQRVWLDALLNATTHRSSLSQDCASILTWLRRFIYNLLIYLLTYLQITTTSAHNVVKHTCWIKWLMGQDCGSHYVALSQTALKVSIIRNSHLKIVKSK